MREENRRQERNQNPNLDNHTVFLVHRNEPRRRVLRMLDDIRSFLQSVVGLGANGPASPERAYHLFLQGYVDGFYGNAVRQ